jgi:hypothetical protein
MSKAKPIDAMTQISHCVEVRRWVMEGSAEAMVSPHLYCARRIAAYTACPSAHQRLIGFHARPWRPAVNRKDLPTFRAPRPWQRVCS